MNRYTKRLLVFTAVVAITLWACVIFIPKPSNDAIADRLFDLSNIEDRDAELSRLYNDLEQSKNGFLGRDTKAMIIGTQLQIIGFYEQRDLFGAGGKVD